MRGNCTERLLPHGWHRVRSPDGTEQGRAIAVDGDGRLMVTGEFMRNSTFGTTFMSTVDAWCGSRPTRVSDRMRLRNYSVSIGYCEDLRTVNSVLIQKVDARDTNQDRLRDSGPQPASVR